MELIESSNPEEIFKLINEMKSVLKDYLDESDKAFRLTLGDVRRILVDDEPVAIYRLDTASARENLFRGCLVDLDEQDGLNQRKVRWIEAEHDEHGRAQQAIFIE